LPTPCLHLANSLLNIKMRPSAEFLRLPKRLSPLTAEKVFSLSGMGFYSRFAAITI